MSDNAISERRNLASNYNVIFGAALGGYLGVEVGARDSSSSAFGFLFVILSLALAFVGANQAADSFYRKNYTGAVGGFFLACALSLSTVVLADNFGFDPKVLGALMFGWGLMILGDVVIDYRALVKNDE